MERKKARQWEEVTFYWDRGRPARRSRMRDNSMIRFTFAKLCGRDKHPSGAAPLGTPQPAVPVKRGFLVHSLNDN
jgi:hypothetical protein